MKYIFLLFGFSLIFNLSLSQVNLEQINASLTSNGNVATVNFNTLNTFVSSGESSNIKIFFKMPSSQTSSSTVVNISSVFPFALTTNIVSGGYRYMFFTATFPIGFDLSTWVASSTYEIGQFEFFNFTGALNVEMYSANQSGSSWNGTSMTKLNAGSNPDNLVTWPISQTVVLPIKLTSFTAVKEGDRNALLDWRSSSESNSDYYGIERSTDGNNWEYVGKVTAAGNSSDERTYSYLDRALPLSRALNQIFYYRLRLVDFDGKFEYSDVRSVIFDKVDVIGDIALFPNPASHLAQLDVSGLDVSDGDIYLRVTDMSGKVILTKDILGNGVEPINVSGWISGTYNFTVTQGEKLYHKRFIKVE